MIFILKVTTNKEDQAADLLARRIRSKNLNVQAIARPHGLRGYLIIEASTRKDAEEAFHNLPYIKNLLRRQVVFKEIEHMLESAAPKVNIEKGDIVEIVSGTLKREKARVVRINKSKEEIVVELLEAAVPIPVTLKIDDVKVIRRDELEDAEKAKLESGQTSDEYVETKGKTLGEVPGF